jgi:flagellar biogenesis protein FliO
MNSLFVALLLVFQVPDPGSVPLSDSLDTAFAAVVPAPPDSESLAKLEAIQKAWDGDSLSRGAAPAAPPSAGSALARIVASLAVLLGLAGLGLLLLRKVRQRKSDAAGRSGSLLDVLETRALGQGNHVTLVRVHDRVVALGHGPGGVSPIAEFHGADAARILAELGDGAVSVGDFTATLDTFLERFRSHPPRPSSGDTQA